MKIVRLSVTAVLCAVTILWIASPVTAAEREQLLSETGVYATFIAFQFDHDWGTLSQSARQSALAEAKPVFTRHGGKLAIDSYLLRGLSDHADFMVRVHGRELRDIQTFVVDLLATTFGRHLTTSIVLNGLIKKANYVPGFPDTFKNELKSAERSGADALCDCDPDS